jgi:hypothetical protein
VCCRQRAHAGTPRACTVIVRWVPPALDDVHACRHSAANPPGGVRHLLWLSPGSCFRTQQTRCHAMAQAPAKILRSGRVVPAALGLSAAGGTSARAVAHALPLLRFRGSGPSWQGGLLRHSRLGRLGGLLAAVQLPRCYCTARRCIPLSLRPSRCRCP